MYHGHGGEMPKEIGPASWFIVSTKNNYMINKWKEECDIYWKNSNFTNIYFWLDTLFKNLFYNDETFKNIWLKVPYLYCELEGQSHTLAHHGMDTNTPRLKQLFLETPPYALKFWKNWNVMFPDITTDNCINSNGYCAITLSKRKYCFKHVMT